eukprot:13714255-Alexandrium_andersonii.AAC.1
MVGGERARRIPPAHKHGARRSREGHCGRQHSGAEPQKRRCSKTAHWLWGWTRHSPGGGRQPVKRS